MDINIKRQLCPRHSCRFFAVLAGGENLPHIAGNSRHAEQSRLLIKDLVKLLARDLSLSYQIGKDARIHGARARAHHETL